jgi:predicted acylesterase/phospholipase RssA
MNVRVAPEHLAQATARQRELVETTYPTHDQVALECDLVMKGGITSGVVYPLAACELAKRYRLRQIGGSSAGAIAAALVAAAEHGRDSGGFNRLAALPATVGERLASLFTPGPHTREAHALVMAALEPEASPAARRRRVVAAGVRSRWALFTSTVVAVLALGAAAMLLAAGWPSDGGDLAGLAGGLALLAPAGLLAGVLVTAVAIVTSTKRGLDRQGFGLCVGSDGPNADSRQDAEPTSLTDWLAAAIDAVAGVDRPLTFGDLWDGAAADDGERAIDLRVMTTNLGHRRPMSFPFETDVFMFDAGEWATYFPPAVAAAMVEASRPALDREGRPWCAPDGTPLRRFPEPAAVPVVVAARLSLSFPGLVSAVPLYAVDFSRREQRDQQPVKLWFSDGGITSNFPIHLFDALWPRRPTFALDLGAYHPDRPGSDVHWPGHASRGRAPRVRRIDDVVGFFSTILDTMQYWADDAQAMLPGYRDRVVEVHLSAHEGGMNLRMPPDVVAIVAEKGRQAAEALADFDLDQHRWTRFLTAMSEMQEAVTLMSRRMDAPTAGDGPSYRELLQRASDLEHYRRSAPWTMAALERTETLLAFADGHVPDFTEDAPRPDPQLRITPRF